MSNRNSISCRRVGDYNIPNLTLPYEEANIRLGEWGMSHMAYLEKHNRVLFNLLLTQGKLYQHCAEIENQARTMFDTLIEQMKEAEGVTEQLKEENQMEWVCRMSNVNERATEIVNQELICT
ncbi:MAG: TnpV protein [Acutalibacteraceae bacterium]